VENVSGYDDGALGFKVYLPFSKREIGNKLVFTKYYPTAGLLNFKVFTGEIRNGDRRV
jgi:hypothetical protein